MSAISSHALDAVSCGGGDVSDVATGQAESERPARGVDQRVDFETGALRARRDILKALPSYARLPINTRAPLDIEDTSSFGIAVGGPACNPDTYERASSATWSARRMGR